MKLRLMLAALLVAPTLVFGASVAVAAPPTTETTHQKGLVETFIDVVPGCEGAADPYEITTTANTVEHVTAFDDGRVHFKFISTGTFVAVSAADPGLPSYSGHFTVSGAFNINKKTTNGTFTFNVIGTGSDGSTLKNHVVEHFNGRPNGTVREFFRCH
jgi:hypothetical protein